MPEQIVFKSQDVARTARGQAVVEARRQVDAESLEIVSVTAYPTVTPGEVFTGEARYLGKVRFEIFVKSGDAVDCISLIADFSDKITSPDITGGNIKLKCVVTECEANYIDGAIRATAVVDTDLFSVVGAATEIANAPGDNVYEERVTLDTAALLESPSELFYPSDSLSGIEAGEVVGVNAYPVVTSAECTSGEVKISGAVYGTVIIKTDKTFVPYSFVTPYSKSLAAPSATTECVAIPFAEIADCTAATVTDGDSTGLEFNVTLKLSCYVFGCGTAEAACDVFCPDSELEVETAEVRSVKLCPIATSFETVDGQVSLDPEKPAADAVLFVRGAYALVSECRVEGESVYAEGVYGGDIIYANAEKNTVDCMPFRLPFSIPLSVSASCDRAEVDAAVTSVNVRVRRESVFDVKAEIAFTVRCHSARNVSIVKSVEKGERINRPEATVAVHIAKPGETIWQVAKALGCSPETVAQSTEQPFKGGERIVNFFAKKK